MSRRVLLGLDVGTSSVKAVTTDLAGRRVADASVRYPTSTEGAAAEQDARAWWAAVVEATRGLTADVEVVAVAVTSQAPTFVPVGADDEPTAPALTWLDRRAAVEAARIAEVVPDSRNGADPFFGTAKLPWLAANRPEAFDRAEHVLTANGYIVRRLTSVSVLDDTSASLMQGFDDAHDGFDPALLDAEPSLRKLAPIVPALTIVGAVTSAAAAATGIPAGTPVAAGGIDSIGSAIEAGAVAAGGPLVDMTGFSSVTILPVPRGTRVPGFIHSRHCVPGLDLLITAQVTAGATIDWVNGLDESRDLRDDERLLARERPSRLTMVTSLAGERTPTWNPRSRGIVDGIDLATDSTELLLAAMEGNARALATDVAAIERAGFPVSHLLSTGGGARSRAWLQIKADVLGVPVHRAERGHGAAQGAAVLAGVAAGEIASFADVVGAESDRDERFEPDAGRTAAYRAGAQRYAELAALNATR
ncbi:xylulokinase [Agromyces silvae]|uniref:xylulokinase n=1 Tax=Agromyces silvae TaxID=3388266 RepID=UPI00280B4F41|nr:FGGY family carbohydrate kinase [Agromyces protaetiae]